MKDKDTDLWKPRNPITQRQIRQQVFRQITIPVLIAAVVVLAVVAVAIFLPSAAGHRVWADIATIWMLLPTIFIGFLFTGITAGITYGVIKLIAALPPLFYKIQNYARLFNYKSKQIGDKIVSPFVKLKSLSTSARAARRKAPQAARRVVGRD